MAQERIRGSYNTISTRLEGRKIRRASGTNLIPTNLNLPVRQLRLPNLWRNNHPPGRSPGQDKLNKGVQRTLSVIHVIPIRILTTTPASKRAHISIQLRIHKIHNPANTPVHERLVHILDEHDLCVDAQGEAVRRHEVGEQLFALGAVGDGAAVDGEVCALFGGEAGNARGVGPFDVFPARKSEKIKEGKISRARGVKVLLAYSSVGAMPSAYLMLLERPLKVSTDSGDSVPKRNSFNMSTNAVDIPEFQSD
jgi:hypothetical protein